MKCYRHVGSEAVGTCKNCHKGLCPECAVDVGNGLACKGACEEEVKALNLALEKAKSAYPRQKQTYMGYARVQALLAAIAVVGGVTVAAVSNSGLILGVAMGAVGLIFGVLAYVNFAAGKRIDSPRQN